MQMEIEPVVVPHLVFKGEQPRKRTTYDTVVGIPVLRNIKDIEVGDVLTVKWIPTDVD